MAYFSNGTEGMRYESEYCDKCAHCEPGCLVWFLHMEWNYEQTKDESKQKALETLIPMDGLVNGKCTMFIEKGKL